MDASRGVGGPRMPPKEMIIVQTEIALIMAAARREVEAEGGATARVGLAAFARPSRKQRRRVAGKRVDEE